MHSKKSYSGLISTVILLLVVAGGWLFRQDISDWWRLRDYEPSSEVVRLADQTTMTDDGRRQFYVTHPQVTDEEAFNANCRQGGTSEYSIVLGCYINTGGLYGQTYIYDIDDERLSGVMQVTAAHEMLHAAYDRLDGDEKLRIDGLLAQAFEDMAEGRIKDTVAQYQDNDPAAVPSELHSILGSEVRKLPTELEDYYRQYFSNRQAIVSFSEQYETEFTRRQNQVERYDQQLARLKATIEANQTDLELQRASLNQQQAQLDGTSDPATFNQQAAAYNQNVAEFNALVSTTRTQIEEHNQLVEVRNKLALEVQELTKAIDSRPESL